jgi:chorismate mutase
MNNLDNFRNELEAVNSSILQSIKKRRLLVKEIAVLKSYSSPIIEQYLNYSPNREWELYNRSVGLLHALSIKELLSFSLLIEDHAGVREGIYPAWSSLDHLTDGSDCNLISMINPLLIALLFPDKLRELSLIDWFQDILQEFR